MSRPKHTCSKSWEILVLSRRTFLQIHSSKYKNHLISDFHLHSWHSIIAAKGRVFFTKKSIFFHLCCSCSCWWISPKTRVDGLTPLLSECLTRTSMGPPFYACENARQKCLNLLKLKLYDLCHLFAQNICISFPPKVAKQKSLVVKLNLRWVLRFSIKCLIKWNEEKILGFWKQKRPYSCIREVFE